MLSSLNPKRPTYNILKKKTKLGGKEWYLLSDENTFIDERINTLTEDQFPPPKKSQNTNYEMDSNSKDQDLLIIKYHNIPHLNLRYLQTIKVAWSSQIHSKDTSLPKNPSFIPKVRIQESIINKKPHPMTSKGTRQWRFVRFIAGRCF